MSKLQSLHSPQELSRSQVGGPSFANSRSSTVMNSTFCLDTRYQVLEVLGTGAYGVVVSATDSVTGETVAIKKIEKAFEDPLFTKRTLRELKVLRLLEHENIMQIKSIQLPVSGSELNEIYVINELMETDLSSIIRSTQPLSDDHVQFFLYQILRGLKFMHTSSILHRDLKPRNLLVNANCDLKICDFGLARAMFSDVNTKATQMTDYVATRWYRPPELLLSVKNYTPVMDMWSVGTIFGELLMRKPILPGSDANHQLDLIFNLNGTPSEEDVNDIPHPRSREKVLKYRQRPAKPYNVVFPDANPVALDLLQKMLVFNPLKRISVEDALAHPYLSALHCPEDEPSGLPVSRYDFEFEREVLTMEDLREYIYEEILLYHFPRIKEEYEQRKKKHLEQ